MKHLPNVLTVGRIVVAPISLYLLWKGSFGAQLAGTVLFILAAITDWLDGRIARQYGVGSRLGQFLDPLADKILVLGGFFLVPFLDPIAVGLTAPFGAWLPWLAIWTIAARDVAVTLLRIVYERQGRSLRTSTSAKWKTAWQLTFLISSFVFLTGTHASQLDGWVGDLGDILTAILASPGPLVFLIVTALVTVYTGAQYFIGGKTDTPAVSPPQSAE